MAMSAMMAIFVARNRPILNMCGYLLWIKSQAVYAGCRL
jgi:hypothetical protein